MRGVSTRQLKSPIKSRTNAHGRNRSKVCINRLVDLFQKTAKRPPQPSAGDLLASE
jgi:hypothetical protein